MWVETFADALNVPRAGYFHCCIIHDIKPHERHQTMLIFCNIYVWVLNDQSACASMVIINTRALDC